jgi:hypothetical protein
VLDVVPEPDALDAVELSVFVDDELEPVVDPVLWDEVPLEPALKFCSTV